MAGEFDLKIAGRDLVFDAAEEPVFISGTEVVAQDVKHRLEEKGLTVDLVADDVDAGATLGRIAFEVEEDHRIRPGTASAQQTAPGTIEVTAETMDNAGITTSIIQES